MSTRDDNPQGPNEEILRKLLQLNPHLRGDGQSTKDVMNGVAKSLEQGTKTDHAPKKPARTLSEELDALIAEHKAAMAELQKQGAALEAFTAKLEAEGKQVLSQACDRVVEAVLTCDPDLTERAHQALFERENAFLAAIGFSGKKLLEAERKRKK